jgi:hypothetical protein
MDLCLDDLAVGGNAMEILDPTWDDVATAISKLDQIRHSAAILSREGSGYIGINGGSGVYFVFIFTEDRISLIPYDAGKPDEPVDLVAGGQEVFFSSRQMVGLDDALRAARHYYETGEPYPSLVWHAD